MGLQSVQLHQVIAVVLALGLSAQVRAQVPITPDPMVPNILSAPKPGAAPAPGAPAASNADKPTAIPIDRPPNNYNIIVNPGRDRYGQPLNPNRTDLVQPWNHLAGGVYTAYTNTGVVRGVYRITDDKIMKNTKEAGYGLGAFLDVPNPGVEGTNLRFRIGAFRTTLTHDTGLQTQYPNQLEKSATLFHFAGILRYPLPMTLPIWAGMGGQMNYALSTKKPANMSPDSKLESTYAFQVILAGGAEIPLNSFNDITFEFDYLPSKGYNVIAGLRASL